MSSAAYWRSLLCEVDRAGLCANPIRLRSTTLDRKTGELLDGDLIVACKDRRASVCPSCSRLYQEDAFQLVAAGIRGGKGVAADVRRHPILFLTLTAPSFGPVHQGSGPAGGRLCRPRRNDPVCEHGRPLACFARHNDTDPLLGEPLCLDCFDYPGAVLWNAHLPRLWHRTTERLYRGVAIAGGIRTSELRARVRLSYLKVIEFQRRGLVHLHVVVRADGAEGPTEPPPPWLNRTTLVEAVRTAVAGAFVQVPDLTDTALRRARWGTQLDVRQLDPGQEGDAGGVAAYVAKYATKTADGSGWLAHPIHRRADLERLHLPPHLATFARCVWDLARRRDLAPLRLRDHVHTLGYPGQFSSKSVRYSTTFGALRGARAAHVQGEHDDAFEYDGGWRYAGRGYVSGEASELARSLHQVGRTVPKRVPNSVPKKSPEP